MKSDHTPIVKITRPALRGIYLRKRLFRLLDQSRHKKICWIMAPPGSGKTTLAASYLDSRHLPLLWYQLDEGDADAATFFHYLGLAAGKLLPRLRKPFLSFTPEYRANSGEFSRRYFRQLVERIKIPFVLLLDNYQEVPPDSEFHSILASGIEELPEGWRVIVLSRGESPPPLARFQANREMEAIGWEDIRLTPEEAFGIAKSCFKNQAAKERLLQLHNQTEGWVAGLLLFLEQASRSGAETRSLNEGAPQSIFDYFASEILDRSDAKTREVLLRTSFLPKITVSTAIDLSGHPEAGEILAGLSLRNYFTVRHEGKEPAYQYHPLFRTFLLGRVCRATPPETLKILRQQAAKLLFSSGQIEDAAALMIEAADWSGLESLLMASAPELAGKGRFQIIEKWLRTLPEDQLDARPWMLYWLGVCRLPFDGPGSRTHFERAFDLFDKSSDPAGLYLSWCGIVDTFVYAWQAFIPLDRWVGVFGDLRKRFPDFPSPEIEARVTYGIFAALSHRQIGHPDFKFWSEKARTLLFNVSDSGFRAMIFRELVNYHTWVDGNLLAARVILDHFKPLFHSPEISPLIQMIWSIAECNYYQATAEGEAAIEAAEAALKIASDSGIHLMDDLLRSWMVWGAVAINDLKRARKILSELAATLNNASLLNVTFYHMSAGHLSFSEGEYPSAREHFLAAISGMEKIGVPMGIMHDHLTLAHIYLALGDDRATEYFNIARRIGEEISSRQMADYMGPMTEAAFALKANEPERVTELLRKAFAAGRDRQVYNPLWFEPRVLSALCLHALEEGIEVPYVQELIRRRGLTPDPMASPNELWPWRVKIHTFGRFALEVDGKPLEFKKGKIQRKPLELLMALIAWGGRRVSEQKLTEALWPDAEGDAAHESFAFTVRRLRKLLGRESVVLLQNKSLSLDDREAWVDTWAFDHLIRRIQEECSGETSSCSYTGDLTRLYQGPFLGKEGEEYSWSLPPRERFRSKFIRSLVKCGFCLIQKGEAEEAVQLFEKGVEIDELAEEFYFHLMASYQILGREAEAAGVYRRCKKILTDLHGIPLSSKTEKLCRQLQGE